MSKSLRTLAPLALVAALGVFIATAGASTPTNGTSVPDSAVAVGTFTGGTPFASGQNINVVIPANSVFSPNANLAVVECSAPDGVIPMLPAACDGNTIQGPTLKPNADGSVNFETETSSLYTVFSLPNYFTLGENPGGPVCGNTAATECILYIGENQNDFTKPHLWSQPFFIDSSATDSGTPAGDGSAPPAATAPSAALSTAVASPTANVANGKDESVVTVTLLGIGNVPVANQTVALTGTGNSTISPEASGSNVTNSSGVATFDVTDTTAETVTYTAADTTDAITLSEQPTVMFAAPEATNVPSGSSTTITVTIGDQGAPPAGVAGQTISLSGSGSTVVITPASTGSNVTNSSGVATFTATDTANETVTFTATDDTDSDLVLSSTAAVTFGNLSVSPTESTVTAPSPQTVGVGTTVTVTLLTADGAPVSGKSVSLTTSSTTATITGSPATSGPNGQATFSVTDSVPESDIFSATDVTDATPITQTTTVAFQTPVPSATASTVSAATPTSVADGQTMTLVTVALENQFGGPESGKTVTLAVTGSAEVHPIAQGGSTPGVTNSAGVAFFEVDDTVAEVVTITATDITDDPNIAVAQTASIAYSAGPPDPQAGTSTVLPSNANPPADGTTPTTLTVTLTDKFGNPVAGQTISLAALAGSATVETVNAVTNAAGQATFTATDPVAEAVTFKAVDVTDGNAALTSEAVVTFGALTVPSATLSDVAVSRRTAPADGKTKTLVIVTINDQNDNPLAGKVVTLQVAPPGPAVVHAVSEPGGEPGVTDDSGIAEFDVTDATAQVVTYTATDTTDGIVVADEPTETFQTPSPPAATPEAPNVLMLGGAGIAVLGAGTALGRRRRTRPTVV